MTTQEKLNHFSDRLTAWLLANKQHPGFDHGQEPQPATYGLATTGELWAADQVAKRIKRDMERKE